MMLGDMRETLVTSFDMAPASDEPAGAGGAPDAEAVSESQLAEAARKVAGNPEVQAALQSVVDLAVASCGCSGASVTLVRADGGVETTASSGGLVEQADELQYSLDEGPCLRAAENGGAYLIVDTAHRRPVATLGARGGRPGPGQRAEHPPVHRRTGCSAR